MTLIQHRMMQTAKLIEKRQQAYLEAMNIPIWVARHQPETNVSVPLEVIPVVEKAAPKEAASLQVEAVLQSPEPAIEVADQTPAEKVTPLGLKLGPGTGGILLVCARDSDSASKLSNDIARSLPKNPVWGWPDSEASAIAPFEAVNENLFTCVAVFGDALAQLLFGTQVPAALGSAKLVILPAMSELKSSAEARRQLWSDLCRSGMVVA